MRILAGVRKKLGDYESGVKCMRGIDVGIAGPIDCQLHVSMRAGGADHLGYLLHELPEVYSLAVDGPRQGSVELRRDLRARDDFVEQHADLIGREGSAALGNSVALKANDTAQAGQVVRDPVVGFGQPDAPLVDLNLHFSFPLIKHCASKGRESTKL